MASGLTMVFAVATGYGGEHHEHQDGTTNEAGHVFGDGEVVELAAIDAHEFFVVELQAIVFFSGTFGFAVGNAL